MNDLPQQDRIRVLIVDDSAVIRAVITRTISAHADMEVAGVAPNGEAAVRAAALFKPDIVILDIEMPVMDGITALPLILKEAPQTRVVICSTLSARGADISLKALSLGATECVLKPGGDSISSAQDFQESLVRLIRTLGKSRISRSPAVTTLRRPALALRPNNQILAPRILAIGSSTGGPRALMEVLKDLKNLSVPIVVTQHMPKTFTTMLAQHIEQNCGLAAHEGAEGMVIRPGAVYIAPGGYHMVFRQRGDEVVVHLDEGPLESFCRPSVNPMMRSLIAIYGSRILTVILTGMGADGLEGCRQLVEQGGQVIAQDEETSVVWGMPGAVANAGLCSSVLPVQQIAARVKQSFDTMNLRSLQK
jgi:two-component system chemotaxis response regulator CheB